MALSTAAGPVARALAPALYLVLATLVLALVVASAPVRAATCTVTTLDDSGLGTLRSHIADSDCAVIDFDVTGTITLQSTLTIERDVTISGPGADQLTISGNEVVRVFHIAADGAEVWLSGITISHGRTSGAGGGVFNSGTLHITASVIVDNEARSGGGGIANSNGTLTVTDSLFSRNRVVHSSFGGGAIHTGGLARVTIVDSTLSENTAEGGGGAIANTGASQLTLASSTISGNVARLDGGGISNTGVLRMTNSTISGNSSVTFDGGALWNHGSARLASSTIVGNSAAGTGGGIRNHLGTVIGKNLITASNIPNNCITGPMEAFSSQGTNFADAPSPSCAGFTVRANIGLGPLADNGGPTATHALLAGSPAIGAATDCTDTQGSAIATDQRGFGRPHGAACDVGAFEFGAVPPPPVITLNADSLGLEAEGPFTVLDLTGFATAKDFAGNPVPVLCGSDDLDIFAEPLGVWDFPVGTTTVTCTAVDDFDSEATASFVVEVNDTTPPGITTPGDLTVEATGPGGADVLFVVEASDAVDGAVLVTCNPVLGSTFPLGETLVECRAVDVSDNEATASFVVEVVDTTAPELNIPDDIIIETTNLEGAEVAFEVTAFDLVDGDVPVTCVPASGSTFPLAVSTTVECSTVDEAGNDATGHFFVTVELPSVGSIDDLLGIVDIWIASGDLLGSGPGQSAAGRLGAWVSMLEAARNALDSQGDTVGGCDLLAQARLQVDGTGPQQFVTGPAARLVAEMLADLMDALGCP